MATLSLLLVLAAAGGILAQDCPTFDTTSYTRTINQNVLSGAELVTVSCTYSGAVQYEILFASLSVSIDPLSGLVTLDEDALGITVGHYSVGIECFDANNPSTQCNVLTNLIVTRSEENEFDPHFVNESPLLITVSESHGLQIPIADLNATDNDLGTFGDIEYRIIDGPQSPFTIDAENGSILLQSSLDYDTILNEDRQLFFIATAVNPPDLATGQSRSATIAVIVTVTDINDEAPVFTEANYQLEVQETYEMGGILRPSEGFFSVSCTDLDSDEDSINYEIVPGENPGPFSMNPATGAFSVSEDLDYEEYTSFSFEVLCHDNGSPNLTSVPSRVDITILPVNEYLPEIISEGGNFAVVTEAQAVGSVLLPGPIVNDADQGPDGDVTFTLNRAASDEVAIFLDVDLLSGDLIVREEIDVDMLSEPSQIFSLSITACDEIPPRDECPNIVRFLLVIALNDNDPMFSQSDYDVIVPESIPVNTILLNASCTDADKGAGELDGVYFVDPTQVIAETFSIDSETGGVMLIASLDYEQFQSYGIQLRCIDNEGLVDEAVVRVEVDSVNDNDPQFTSPSYEFNVSQTTPSDRFPIGSVQATDDDQGEGGELQYSFAQDNSFFRITDSGFIQLFQSLLNFTDPIILLEAQASDGYTTVSANVTIHVTEGNFNEPKFTSEGRVVSVSELLPVGTSIFSVACTDDDSGSNAMITYSIEEGNTEEVFTIDPDTGEITTADVLILPQNATNRQYELLIQCRDGGVPVLSRDTSLLIFVYEDDSTAPNIANDTIYAFVNEDADVNDIVITIFAADLDDTNLRFEIRDASIPNIFLIDPSTGEVSVAAPLDREVISMYQMTVVVSEVKDPGDISPIRSDNATLVIFVRDVNDNTPMCSTLGVIMINDSLAPGSIIAQLECFDLDIGENGDLLYSISNDYGVLSINSLGELILNNSLEQTELTNLIVFIDVEDQGIPSRKNTYQVTILISLTNRFAPSFTNLPDIIELAESRSTNTIVYTVEANDLDQGSFGEITYAIVNTTSENTFIIIPNTGNILLTGELSHFQQSTHVLSISASDGTHTTIETLTINVIDENNYTPSCDDISAAFSVPESVQTPLVVGAISCTDNDEGSNGEIVITITFGNTDDTFEVDSNGSVIATKALDFETESLYILRAEVTDSGSPPLQADVLLLIFVIIEPVNEFAPSFNQQEFFYQIDEHASISTSILDVTATDMDAGLDGDIVYTIVDIEQSPFTITSDGVLQVADDIDREKQETYQFTIQATDQGLPPMSDMANVTIVVNDLDDNSPEFSFPQYSAVLNQTVDVNTSVLTLNCTDQDIEANAAVVYSIDSSADSQFFQVDNISGMISVKGSLPISRTYTFIATCTGLGPGNFSDTAVVSIQVVVESNITFVPSSRYTVQVAEDRDPGFILLQVMATSSLEVPLAYSLLSTGTPFVVETNTGTLLLVQPLDYETVRSYSLQIQATDSGTPPNTGLALVQVNVENVNDEVPRISTSPSVILLTEELVSVPMVIGQYECSDGDSGTFGEVNFHIATPNVDSFFFISESGSLQLIANLDYESAQQYDLNLVCEDGGSPSPLSDSINVPIVVTPANDNPPIFPSSSVTISIEESLPQGSSFGPPIQAMDNDLPPHNNLHYSIVSGDLDRTFFIDSSNGQFSLLLPLDYETTASYTLVIVAEDSGGEANPEFVVLNSSTTVMINVIDVNDNSPFFSLPFYLGDIPETAAVGDFVMLNQQIICSDVDSGENGEVTLQITGGNTNNSFSIQQEGFLIVENELSFDLIQRYELIVECRDNGNPQRVSEVEIFVNIDAVSEAVPEFTNSTYSFRVSENITVGTAIGAIEAIGRLGPGTVTYMFTNNSAAPFVLNPNTGSISVTSSLDYETQDRLFVLGASATDFANMTAFTIIIIEIINIDDNVPMFTENDYFASISENAAVGAFVTRIICVDADDAADGVLPRYTLLDSHAPFTVIDGTITVGASLDLETEPRYILDILCRDSDGNLASATLRIDLEPFNDFHPVFIDAPYEKELIENPVTGSLVIVVRATDDDIIEYNDITFSIISGDESGRFAIHDTSGEVTVANTIDREVQSLYVLEIEAVNVILPDDVSGSEALSDRTTLTINVIDVNDNDPVITADQSSVFIPETNSSGVVVTDFICTDADSDRNGETTFSLFNTALASQFEILDNGTLLTADSITGNIVVEVVCSDNGIPRRSSIASVIIETVSMNDHQPVFEQRHYTVIVDEDQPIGVNIMCFHATDMDGSETPDGIIQYSLDSFGLPENEVSRFSIGRDTGCVFATLALDGSDLQLYTYTLVATDQGETPMSGIAYLVIIINDVLHDPPVFEGSPYARVVSEGSESGTFIASTLCTDTDINDNITYSIVDGNDGGLFSIDSQSGLIELAQDQRLDYETAISHVLVVQCIDSFNLTDVANVFVTVTPVNEFTPVFQSLDAITVPEHSIQGTPVTQLMWTDADEGPDGEVTFTIVSGNVNNGFLVTRDGRILVAGVLDRESRDSYRLEIQISDLPADLGEQRSSINHINITVTDINDHAPVFSAELYTFGPLEGNEAPGHFIGGVSCSDNDIGTNAEISYHISAGSDVQFLFDIDSQNGDITLSGDLDMRNSDAIGFIVECIDVASVEMTGTGRVIVTVEEFNRFPPEFTNSSYYAQVSEDRDVGDTILTVHADDRDSGVNGQVHYFLRDNLEVFYLNEITGELSLLSSLDFESVIEYNLVIEAVDGALDSMVQLTATANITIEVLGANEHNPFCTNANTLVIINGSTHGDILSLNCIDDDAGPDGMLVYTLTSGNTGGLFSVTADGRVTIPSPIVNDATNGTEQYALQVTVSDSGTVSRQTIVDVTVVYSYENLHSPTFNASEYFLIVSELEPVGRIVATFIATDMDISLQGQLHYIITETDSFKIDPNSGELFVAKPLDYETSQFHQFVITAQDSDPYFPLSGSATVNIAITNADDSTPYCSQPYYSIEVFSNASVNDDLFSPDCTDPDGGSLEYEQVGSSYFGVREASGQIYVSQPLLPSSTDIITILVRDGMGHTTEIGVIVQINFINADPPSFSESNYTLNVAEDVAPLSVIGEVMASDTDSSVLDLVYSIVNAEQYPQFYLNPQNGQLILTENLDYEFQQEYLFTVVVQDGGSFDGSNPLSNMATVTVLVENTNDNEPRLVNGSVHGTTVASGTLLNTIVLSLSCYDSDEAPYGNPTITGSGFTGTPFIFNSLGSEGRVLVSGALSPQEYSYTITCIDGGGVSVEGQLYIFVLEGNAPMFNQDMYKWIINETSPTGSQYSAIQATSSSGSSVLYSLTVGDAETFYIHPSTGVVTLVQNLDYEVREIYSLVVTATDSNNRQSSVLLIVEVINENDQQPTVSPSITFTVPHNAPIGYPLGEIVCTDNDSSTEVIFSPPSNFFSINQLDIITVQDTLDAATPIYTLPFICSDSNSPTMNIVAVATIEVLFDNQHPPEFEYSSYAFSVSESIPVLSTVGSVFAFDGDAGSFGEIMYISGANGSDKFYVETTTGHIRLLSPLDRETEDSYSIMVLAIDGGPSAIESSRMIGMTTVSIFVVDVNDNPPVPDQLSYIQTISATHSIFDPILSVHCSDQDDSDAGRVSYFIEPPSDVFAVQENGTIILIREQFTQEVHHFTVMCTDNGFPVLSSSILVTVLVDIPEPESPTFNMSLYMVEVPENTLIGMTVLVVNAKVNSEVGVTYSIEGGNEDGHFYLEPSSGEIIVIGSLSNNTQQQYILSIRASTTGRVIVSSFTAVIITVTDLNNSPPEFTAPFYVTAIDENSAPNSPVVQVNCTDPDVNSEITYQITSGQDTFTITDNGLVTVAGEIDYETSSIHTVQVTCSDGYYSPVTATIRVQVIPINEYLPVFSQPVYRFSASENSVGVSVGTVEATDQDAGSDGEVVYHLQDPGNFSVIFLEPSSGDVVLARNLDYEFQEVWNVTILARDGAGAESYAFIEITVVNINDVQPVILPPISIVSVPVDSPPNFPVQSYLCTDDDGSMTTLSIEGGNTFNYFQLNSFGQLVWTGIGINLTSNAVVSLTIQCQDSEVPTQKSFAYITITIRTADTVSPEFTESLYSAVVAENTQTGTSVTRVLAIGENQLYYDLFNLPSDFPFAVNETTGDIIVTGFLDRESVSVFVFTVRATDTVLGEVGLAFIQITIADVNDNAPSIDSLLHPVALPENFPLFTPFYNFYCSDVDAGINGDFSIEVIAGDVDGLFGTTSAGSLQLVQSLDFESAESHNLTIACIDRGVVQLSTNATLLVLVTGVNEHAPLFVQDSYNFTLPEDTPAGRSIGIVSATDDDGGEDGEIRFELVGGSGEGFFTVSSLLGEIHTSVRQFDAATNEKLEIIVRAQDPGSLSNDITVTIYIEDTNEAPVFVAPDGLLAIISSDQSEVGSIFSFSCIDADTPSNAVLSLTIISNPSELDVYLQDTEGLSVLSSSIVTNSTLTAGAYQLGLRCTDSGNPPLYSEVNVTVRVEGANTPPSFSHGVVSKSIREDAPLGTFIATVNATDAETSVTYGITGGNGLGLFSIGQFSGDITLSFSLDYETVDSYEFTVTAFDESRFDPQSSSIQVFIFVFNTNDNPPLLTPPGFQQRSLSENTAPVFHITSYTCSDPDGGAVSFSIEPQHGPLSPFDITPSGTIQLLDPIDHEVENSYDLTIVCTDELLGSFSDVLTTTSILHIDIRPENNYSPEILSPTNFQVPENVRTGTVIAQVEAIDEDFRGEVTYSSDSFISVFLVDSSSGNITLRQGLDYETTRFYPLTIIASDNDPLVQPRDTAFVVTINVTDVNDNQPICNSLIPPIDLYTGTYTYISLANLSCTDNDEGSNAVLTYSFIDTNLPSITTGEFLLNNKTGELGFQGTLQIAEILIIDIQVSDSGAVPLSTQINVIVQVISESGPRFIPSRFNVTISENTQTHSTVLMGSVLRDALENPTGGDVSYALSFSSGSLIPFRIDYSTADIVLVPTPPIDYDEGMREFTLLVEASVNGDMASAIVIITLSDYNDNVPTFEESVYIGVILENQPPNTPVIFTADDTTIDIQATDADSNINGQFTFSIQGSTEFSIDPSSGDVTSLIPFDREVLPAYSFTVVATDMGTPTQSGTALVTILIGDVNDVAPHFASSIYTININNLSPPGTELATLRVSDGDTSEVQRIDFIIVTDNPQVLELFAVDADGTLRQRAVAIPDDHALQYNFTVKVNDGIATDSTIVLVYVFSITSAMTLFEENVLNETFNLQEFLILQELPITDDATYTIINGNEGNAFSIDSNGILSNTVELDREETALYELIVQIDDVMTLDNALVVVQVADQNDNAPVFQSEPYFFTITEGTYSTSILIGAVNATDRDEPNSANSRIEYSFVSAQDIFTIDQLTGAMYVQGLVDRETTDSYRLRVRANDFGGPVSKISYSEVTITVSDVNDNDPAFFPLDVVEFLVEIPDIDIPVGTQLTRIYAILPGDIAVPLSEFTYTDRDSTSQVTSTLITLDGDSKYELVGTDSQRYTEILRTTALLDKMDNGTLLQIALSDDLDESNPVVRNITVLIGTSIIVDPTITTPSTGGLPPDDPNFFDTDLGIAVIVVICVLVLALLFFLCCLLFYCTLRFQREKDPRRRQRPFTVAQRIQTETERRGKKFGRPWEYYSYDEIDQLEFPEFSPEDPESQYLYGPGLEFESSFMGVDYDPEMAYNGDPSTATSVLSTLPTDEPQEEHTETADQEAYLMAHAQPHDRSRTSPHPHNPQEYSMGPVLQAMMHEWDKGEEVLQANLRSRHPT